MSYAELGTVVNKSGGEFSFYQCAFADMHKFWGPLPSFIYSWVSIMYVRPAEVAIIILTFAEYAIRPFSLLASMTEDDEYLLKKIVSILALGESAAMHRQNTGFLGSLYYNCIFTIRLLLSIGIITFINYTSVKCFIKIQNVFTVCKVTACIVVIVGGVYQLYIGIVKSETLHFFKQLIYTMYLVHTNRKYEKFNDRFRRDDSIARNAPDSFLQRALGVRRMVSYIILSPEFLSKLFWSSLGITNTKYVFQDGYHRGVRRNKKSPKVCKKNVLIVFKTSSVMYVLIIVVFQKHITEYSSCGTICHHDLRHDERVLFNSTIGRRNDQCPRRGSCKCLEVNTITIVFVFTE